eukprot:m.333652 g.333652  ORF g.333652 m.333652 type:complete len:139 (+) comp55652_c0_seq2:164-580(+)
MDAEDHTAHLRGALTRAAFKDAIVASFFHYITELSLAGVHAIAVIYRPVFLSRCISDRVNVGAAQGSQESSENVAPLLLHVPLCVNLTRLSLKCQFFPGVLLLDFGLWFGIVVGMNSTGQGATWRMCRILLGLTRACS